MCSSSWGSADAVERVGDHPPGVGPYKFENVRINRGYDRADIINQIKAMQHDTVIPGEGNLTYVCNSGFNRWWYSPSAWNAVSA